MDIGGFPLSKIISEFALRTLICFDFGANSRP